MTPRWILEKRTLLCLSCEQAKTCRGKFHILDDAPQCPRGIMATTADEIAARAWPDGAPEVSGCCDSALNYLSQRAGM